MRRRADLKKWFRISFGPDFANLNRYRLHVSIGPGNLYELKEGELIPYWFAVDITLGWPLVSWESWKEREPHWISSWRVRTKNIQFLVMPLVHRSKQSVQLCAEKLMQNQ